MRIHSNTLLSWPQILHVSQAARLSRNSWLNYHFYKIQKTRPLIITTNSPIEYLEENCQYYLYENYYHNSELNYGNTYEHCSYINKNKLTEAWIYIPKNTQYNDIIVLQHNNDGNKFYNINFNSFNLPLPIVVSKNVELF